MQSGILKAFLISYSFILMKIIFQTQAKDAKAMFACIYSRTPGASFSRTLNVGDYVYLSGFIDQAFDDNAEDDTVVFSHQHNGKEIFRFTGSVQEFRSRFYRESGLAYNLDVNYPKLFDAVFDDGLCVAWLEDLEYNVRESIRDSLEDKAALHFMVTS